MSTVERSPKVRQDTAVLAQGVARVDVALAVLRDFKLTSNQIQQLEALLKRSSPTESAPSSTQSPDAGRLEFVDGHSAVLGHIEVNGQQLDTILTEGSFTKTQSEQIAYATTLGCRMATREENLAYVEALLAKEEDGSINGAEATALHTYNDRFVRDIEGGLEVVDRRVNVSDGWNGGYHDYYGALFVRAPVEVIVDSYDVD